MKRNLFSAHDRAAVLYKKQRTPHSFKIGDLVYCRNHPTRHAERHLAAKLGHRWKGPFRICRMLTPVTVELVNPQDGKVVTRAHVSHLKATPTQT